MDGYIARELISGSVSPHYIVPATHREVPLGIQFGFFTTSPRPPVLTGIVVVYFSQTSTSPSVTSLSERLQQLQTLFFPLLLNMR